MSIRYEYTIQAYNESQLTEQIQALNPQLPGFLGVFGTAPGVPTVLVDFEAELSPFDKARLDAVVAAHVPELPRQIRTVFAIYTQLVTLTTTQQDAITADLQVSSLSGKWTELKPPQDAPAAAFRWAAVSLSGATANEKRQAAGWIVAMWCQQNPKYLVNPTFHASLAGVNIPGDEPIS